MTEIWVWMGGEGVPSDVDVQFAYVQVEVQLAIIFTGKQVIPFTIMDAENVLYVRFPTPVSSQIYILASSRALCFSISTHAKLRHCRFSRSQFI